MARVTICSEPLIEKYGEGFPETLQQMQSCSGDALNIAGAITKGTARIGEFNGKTEKHEVTVLCGLGDDAHGEAIQNYMSGVTTGEPIASLTDVVTLRGRKTSGYEITQKPSTTGRQERSVTYINRSPDSAMCQLFQPGEHETRAKAKLDYIGENTDVFIVTGIGASRTITQEGFDKLIALVSEVKKNGGKIVVDFNHRLDKNPDKSISERAKLWVDEKGEPYPNNHIRAQMDRLYALADVAFIAHDEIWPVYADLYKPAVQKGEEPTAPAPMVAHLRTLKAPEGLEGKRHIVFKRGKDGGTLFVQNASGADTVIETRGVVVTPVDRNGGGDNLIGGTVAGMLRGYTLDQSLAVGQLMAGKVIQHPGGVIKKEFLPTDEELRTTIKPEQTPEKWQFKERVRERPSALTRGTDTIAI